MYHTTRYFLAVPDPLSVHSEVHRIVREATELHLKAEKDLEEKHGVCADLLWWETGRFQWLSRVDLGNTQLFNPSSSTAERCTRHQRSSQVFQSLRAQDSMPSTPGTRGGARDVVAKNEPGPPPGRKPSKDGSLGTPSVPASPAVTSPAARGSAFSDGHPD